MSHSSPDIVISVNDPTSPTVQPIIESHLRLARSSSPPEHVHALNLDGLRDPDVTFFTASIGSEVVGMAALRHLDGDRAEVKSMHVVEAARGQGVGGSLLAHLFDVAKSWRCREVLLETGTMDAFEPARSLYLGAGFRVCPPFGSYTENPFSVCMSRPL